INLSNQVGVGSRWVARIGIILVQLADRDKTVQSIPVKGDPAAGGESECGYRAAPVEFARECPRNRSRCARQIPDNRRFGVDAVERCELAFNCAEIILLPDAATQAIKGRSIVEGSFESIAADDGRRVDLAGHWK